MLSTLSVEDLCSAGVLGRIKGKLDDINQKRTTRTAMLWLQYLDMDSILQRVIKAERMANWKLHLQTVRDVLPYFAASGHSLCRVCIRIPANHASSARNSSRCAQEIHGRIPCGETQWHVLGRIVHRHNHRASACEKWSIKTHGGLTRGNGMTENQRLVWVLTMHVCASINETMFNGVSYETSDQHTDVSAARRAQYDSDTVDLMDYLNERDPFVQNYSLFNIANGMTAQIKSQCWESKRDRSKVSKINPWQENQLTSSHSGKLIEQSR